MDTVFINSKNSGTSDPHRLLLNLTDKKKISIEKKELLKKYITI